LSIVYDFKIIDYEIPIPIKKEDFERVRIDKKVKLDQGILHIKELVLGSVSTRLRYEYLPSDNDNVVSLNPNIKMFVNNQKFSTSSCDYGLSGELKFPIPLEAKDLDNVKFEIVNVEIEKDFDQTIHLDCENLVSSHELEGAQLSVDRMEIVDGSTFIDISVNEGTRNYYDFHISPDFHIPPYVFGKSVVTSGGIEFTNKELENKHYNQQSMNTSDYTKTIVRKKIVIEGEHKQINLIINKLIIKETCDETFRIK
ncbi:hypothetical protein RBH29_07485, partial [Herbivorax sp. ANBcel31]|uniref:hypothetical protein n=1 Tax=Herbivorax sp. ANBcel31 TaxID=3069754 RepID=UPI0027B44893